MLRIIYTAILFILLFASSANQCNAINDTEIKDILLINSYHPTFQWTKELTDGVLSQLPESQGYRLSIEFMDTKRFHEDIHLQAIECYFREKYRYKKVDGVICSDNHAFEFFLEHGHEIWGDVPMSFCGVNNILDFNLDTTKYKGIAENINIKETLALITTIQPDLKQLIVISDSTLSGKIFTSQFKSTAKKFYPTLDYQLIITASSSHLINELKQFSPDKKAIYLLSPYIPQENTPTKLTLESDYIHRALDVPIYGNWNFLFDDHIIGGVLINGYDQGVGAGNVMKNMKTGNISNIPFLKSTPQRLILDYQQLLHYNIDLRLVPKGTIYLNKPNSYLEKNKKEILVAGGILSFLIIVIIALLHIITLKNKAESNLSKSEKRLEMALEGANVGLWDIDFNNKDVFLNERVGQLLDYDSNLVSFYNLSQLQMFVHPQDIDQLKESYFMHAGGLTEAFSGELRLKTANNSYKWFSVHGRITEKHEGKPQRMIGILMDADFQKEFEEQLKIAKERAEESDRLKSAFLANMSHEIRTPMNAILGFCDILLDEEDIKNHESCQKYLKIIKNSGESLLHLINDIIDISKIESGQIKLNIETFDLHSLLDNMQIVTSSLISNKGKRIDFKMTREFDKKQLFITADPYRIEQILYNLLSNAIKFTESGSIELSYMSKTEKFITFSVKDSGRGIHLKDHELIFERFQQAKSETPDNKGGTGLGLAITKSLVNLMGGEIYVESELNCGATFSFTIPCSITSIPKNINA